MTEMDKLAAQKRKLNGICEENDFTYFLDVKTYPISLVIRPLQTVDAQLSMIEEVEDKGFTSPNARLVFEMKDGDLAYKISERFAISEALFNKIKNIFKKIVVFYTQAVHRNAVEHQLMTMPDVPEDDTDMTAEDLAEEAELDEEQFDCPDDFEESGI